MFKTLAGAALTAAALAGPRATRSALHTFTGPLPEVARLTERTPTAAILTIPLG